MCSSASLQKDVSAVAVINMEVLMEGLSVEVAREGFKIQDVM